MLLLYFKLALSIIITMVKLIKILHWKKYSEGIFGSLFRENNVISVWNNGKGIPIVEHKVEKLYVPALIFGQLLTSSNYDDNEKKVTGRRHSTRSC